MPITHNRSFLEKAAGLEDNLKRAAGEVTHFASTEIEFGLMKKMNDGLDRFFAQLREAAEPQPARSRATPLVAI